jgi:DNA-binding NarL/FixJ family response regulator
MTAPADSRRVIELTASQRAVLGQLTLDGADNPTIAARLNITVHTVKSHVKGIMDAFGVPTRTAVVVDCLRGRVSIRVVENRGRRRSRSEGSAE